MFITYIENKLYSRAKYSQVCSNADKMSNITYLYTSHVQIFSSPTLSGLNVLLTIYCW